MRTSFSMALGAGLCLAAMACSDRATNRVSAPTTPSLARGDAMAMTGNPAPGFSIPAATTPLQTFRSFTVLTTPPTLLPATLSATLSPGQEVSEHKTASIPGSPPLGDVVFSLDLTGSMGDELNNMKVNAINIMNAVAAVIPDVRFGVISYMDYPGTYVSSIAAGHGCDYADSYGTPSVDLPYRLSAGITSDRSAVSATIGALNLGFGDDTPESYSRVFYESYAELIGNPNPTYGPIGWRPGSKKILVNFEDAMPHDCDFDAILGGTSDTGVDPGRDGIVGTADDLHILSVLAGMKANNVTLINLNSDGLPLNPLWDAYAAMTGGTNFLINSDGSFPGGVDPATAIAKLIQTEVSTIDLLTLEPCSGFGSYASWIKSLVPASYSKLTLPATSSFDITYTVPAGTAPGVYSFKVCAVGDGVEYASQQVTITVPGGTTFQIDIEPEDPSNQVALRGSWLPVAVLSTSTFDATTLKPEECRLRGDYIEGIRPVANLSLARDYDNDGDKDLILFFSIPKLVKEGNLTSTTKSMTLRCQGGLVDSDVVVPH